MSTTPTPTPTLTLDQALQAVTANEATYNADVASVMNIQTAISTATAPLAAAEATVQTDLTNWITSLQTAQTLIQNEITSLQALQTPAGS